MGCGASAPAPSSPTAPVQKPVGSNVNNSTGGAAGKRPGAVSQAPVSSQAPARPRSAQDVALPSREDKTVPAEPTAAATESVGRTSERISNPGEASRTPDVAAGQTPPSPSLSKAPSKGSAPASTSGVRPPSPSTAVANIPSQRSNVPSTSGATALDPLLGGSSSNYPRQESLARRPALEPLSNPLAPVGLSKLPSLKCPAFPAPMPPLAKPVLPPTREPSHPGNASAAPPKPQTPPPAQQKQQTPLQQQKPQTPPAAQQQKPQTPPPRPPPDFPPPSGPKPPSTLPDLKKAPASTLPDISKKPSSLPPPGKPQPEPAPAKPAPSPTKPSNAKTTPPKQGAPPPSKAAAAAAIQEAQPKKHTPPASPQPKAVPAPQKAQPKQAPVKAVPANYKLDLAASGNSFTHELETPIDPRHSKGVGQQQAKPGHAAVIDLKDTEFTMDDSGVLGNSDVWDDVFEVGHHHHHDMEDEEIESEAPPVAEDIDDVFGDDDDVFAAKTRLEQEQSGQRY